MKKIQNQIIKYVNRNANQIRKKDFTEQNTMMGSYLTCVLRPSTMPAYMTRKISDTKWESYIKASRRFTNREDIDKALKWVKSWVKKL